MQLKETTDAFSVYNFQAAATITTADQAEHAVEFSGVVQLTSDGKADYMNLYGSGMDMIDSIVSQPLQGQGKTQNRKRLRASVNCPSKNGQ